MKKQTLSVFTALIIITFTMMCGKKSPVDYPVKPVPFTDVRFDDDFWFPRMETNREVTIPYAFQQCQETGRIKNFEIAAGMEEGGFCTAYPFDDSDVYKIIEGASYSLKIHPDPALEKRLEEILAKIEAAQEEDGYLYTARTIFPHPPKVRWVDTKEPWTNMFLGHELYNAGHMYEAAVAHFQATGKRTFLDIALKNADLIEGVFGPGKKIGVPGHQEIEIGLVKLYRVTGEKKYLDLAKFFLDERGYAHNRELYGEYSQDHKPVLEQTEPVGHAVRAAYMYSGMADVAALTKDEAYREALETLWNNVVSKKMYITGGIGSKSGGESFGEDYELPNATAYCETCAAIANALWNHRMFLLSGDAKYIDVLERVLYNNILSGIDLEGNRFFYSNPLESHGQGERSPWFTCSCCPSNVSRFIPSVPGYVYAVQNHNLYINLFVKSLSEIPMEKGAVTIRQDTSYPWDGKVNITITPEKPKTFTVFLRIPGWTRNQAVPSGLYRYAKTSNLQPEVRVAGDPIEYSLEKGFVPIKRKWNKGDTITLTLPMPIRRVLSHENVEANEGRVALERGPIVYCAEGIDNQGSVISLVLDDDAPLEHSFREDLLNGVVVITGKTPALKTAEESTSSAPEKPFIFAIPYYAWAHRGPGEMIVWINRK
ncbi:MAG: glycoside hydrolase family 127 protein [Candidatus Aminicenantes bacterium]|nr:glycoside hydrolase family 127 protein [Candidatus Aminicenantes bacterium]